MMSAQYKKHRPKITPTKTESVYVLRVLDVFKAPVRTHLDANKYADSFVLA